MPATRHFHTKTARSQGFHVTCRRKTNHTPTLETQKSLEPIHWDQQGLETKGYQAGHSIPSPRSCPWVTLEMIGKLLTGTRNTTITVEKAGSQQNMHIHRQMFVYLKKQVYVACVLLKSRLANMLSGHFRVPKRRRERTNPRRGI